MLEPKKLKTLGKNQKGKLLLLQDENGNFENLGVIKTLGKKYVSTDKGIRKELDDTICLTTVYNDPNRLDLTEEAAKVAKEINKIRDKYSSEFKTDFGKVSIGLLWDGDEFYVDGVDMQIDDKAIRPFLNWFDGKKKDAEEALREYLQYGWDGTLASGMEKHIKKANDEMLKVLNSFISKAEKEGYATWQAFDLVEEYI